VTSEKVERVVGETVAVYDFGHFVGSLPPKESVNSEKAVEG